MKARDLRDRTTEDLAELERSLSGESFQNKFKNFTNRLDDTSVIGKSRKDLARVKLILAERARGMTVVYKAPEATPNKPKTRAPKPAPEKADVEEAAESTEASETKETAAKKKPAKSAAKAAPAAKTKAKAEPAAKSTAKKPKPKTAKGSK
jgi:large subunit ribosomal protein L29